MEEIEFKTVDGVTIRGRLYLAKSAGPGVVMSPGFNAVQDMVGLQGVAQQFSEAGINAMTFDCRSTGVSDGEPRNDIDPFRQTEDLSDALSFLAGHPNIDRNRLGLWGMSLGGATALSAASLDRRAKFVIAVAPASEYTQDQTKLPNVLSKMGKDRGSRAKGNSPLYVPMLTADGENPAGFNMGVDKEYGMRLVGAQDMSDPLKTSLAPNHVNKTTLESYRRLLMWQPSHTWKHLKSTPSLFIVPEIDQLIPPEVQAKHFEQATGPKTWYLAKGRTHLDVLEGEDASKVQELQTEFIKTALGM